MQKKENCINKKITDSAAKLFLLDFASTFCLGVFRCKGDRSVSSEHSKNTKQFFLTCLPYGYKKILGL